jgi:hypothetical protein
VDLLVTSAFVGSYWPTPGTLLGALKKNLDIDLLECSKSTSIIDLKDVLGCWICREQTSEKFKNIMVVEMSRGFSDYSENDIKQSFRNIFIAISMLQQMNILVKTIVLPALGSGNQMLNHNLIIRLLINAINEALPNIQKLERVLFMERTRKKAKAFSKALDSVLKRSDINVPVNDVLKHLQEDILKLLRLNANPAILASQTYSFLEETFKNPSNTIAYGIASRRLIEKLIAHKYYSTSTETPSFYAMITDLRSNKNIAGWIISYLHLIRILGNESAHGTINNEQIPANIEIRDISLLLFCVHRVLVFIFEQD